MTDRCITLHLPTIMIRRESAIVLYTKPVVFEQSALEVKIVVQPHECIRHCRRIGVQRELQPAKNARLFFTYMFIKPFGVHKKWTLFAHPWRF